MRFKAAQFQLGSSTSSSAVYTLLNPLTLLTPPSPVPPLLKALYPYDLPPTSISQSRTDFLLTVNTETETYVNDAPTPFRARRRLTSTEHRREQQPRWRTYDLIQSKTRSMRYILFFHPPKTPPLDTAPPLGLFQQNSQFFPRALLTILNRAHPLRNFSSKPAAAIIPSSYKKY
jgi:hypothetical protein